MTEPPAYVFTDGPAVTFSELVPDMHYFMGHHGGRVLPLYRDTAGQDPNTAPRLLESLSKLIRVDVKAEDMIAYVAAIVANPAFTAQFCQELTKPGIRVPVTRDKKLWQEAVDLGREVLWIHTYGERCVDEKASRPRGLPLLPKDRRPAYSRPIPTSEFAMPNVLKYDESTETLVVGDETLMSEAGAVEHVSSAVRWYTVGGTCILDKWFSYRQQTPRRKRRTSELDRVNPQCWTAQFDDELLALLNVLGRCVALEPRQASLLDRVCSGPLITSANLERVGAFPVPDAFRKPPRQLGDTIL